jgi:peptide/nickel transport system substrate-binding protein
MSSSSRRYAPRGHASVIALAATALFVASCGSSAVTTPASSTSAQASSTSAPASSTSAPGSAAASGTPALQPGDARTPAVAGGDVTVGLNPGGIDHLDPALWYFQTTWQIGYATCTTLVTYPDKADQTGAEVVGGLADMPEVSAAGTTYKFTLRDGVRFAGGAPITGADVKYTFERMLSPKLASPGAPFYSSIVGAADYMAGKASSVSGITAQGSAVTFKLENPPASFLARMTMPFACVVPSGTPMQPIEDGSILKTGPYVVQSYSPQRELVLVRNPEYNATALGARGVANKITINTTVDPTQAALLTRSGQIATSMDLIASADAGQALNDPSLKGRVFADPVANITHFWMNTQVAPLDNVKVRQAVNFAINRAALQRILGGPGQVAVADQILPPTMAGWTKADIYPANGDPEKAKALLAEAGVTLPIEFTVHTSGDQAGQADIAQAIQEQLKAVGINMKIDLKDSATDYAYTTTVANKAQAGIDTWSQDYPHPDDFIGVLLDGDRIAPTLNQNRAMFNVPEINQKIHELEVSLDPSAQAAWHQLDAQIIRDYAPWAPLVNGVRVSMVADGYCGLLIHPVYQLDLTTLGHCQ